MQHSSVLPKLSAFLLCLAAADQALLAQELTPARAPGSFVAASSLTGTWAPIEVTVHGYALPEERRESIRFEISDGRFRFTSHDIVETGTVVVREGTDGLPASIDLDFEQGPNQGTIVRGICKLEDGKLVICYATGGDRPTEFSSTLESETLLLEYQRIEK